MLSLHNKLRSKVQPPAANMQKLVSAPGLFQTQCTPRAGPSGSPVPLMVL